MKKTLSLILALLMSVSSASMIFADEAADVEPISAVTEEAPVEEAETDYDLAIEFLVNKSIMKGKEDGLRHAEDPVKRYEMAILTARVATGWTEDCDWMNGEADNTKFTDLEGSGAANALGAVSYANQKGIVVGYPDSTFKPENQVTYREALTMAVRTLGYTSGLEYPWGFIEKAVSLGLTEDIEDVAYTAPINRGVAAQIIYNALFAKTASGETLAMKSFDCEYGWEKIIVVADEIESYEANGLVTAADKGIVAFKLVNNDGTFGDETFYVKKDLTVGVFYEALFEMDADEELVDLIGAYEYIPTTIWNYGITDDEKNEVTADNIKAYLEDYVLVDKYNVKNLSKTTLYDDELILKGVNEIEVFDKYNYEKTEQYAIDWESGDILKWNKDTNAYETIWWYNEIYETYFAWCDDEIADKDIYAAGDLVGINIMSAEELEELKKDIKASYAEYVKQTGYTVIGKPGYSAFASLEVYDLNEDGMGDYATYEDYTLGVYEGIVNNADACGDHDNQAIKVGGNLYTLEDSCSHFNAKGYTWAEGYEPTEGYTGYVIYGVNEAKNEVKIVKEIESGVDADSYVATGIVRGVKGSSKKVVIGDETFSYDWTGLKGAEFNTFDAQLKTASAKFFNKLFNQFVEYVVVDGKIAAIDVKNAGGNEYIVVERYLGVDSDGYIVVEGYSTEKLELATFRIGAFDGWKQGNVFFYEDVIEGEFVKGNVYKITSKDTTEANGDVYYVTAIGNVRTAEDNNGKEFEVVKGVAGSMNEATISRQDNYRVVDYTAADKTDKTKRVADGQKYVIIGDVDTYALGDYMPIYTFTGKIPAGWSVKGDLLVDTDDLIIIVNVESITGFKNDTYKTGYVVLLDEYYKNIEYDGYGKDYYIYGAVKYEVEAFNLLTAKTDDVAVGYNLDLDTKEIYTTIDGNIVKDTAFASWTDFWNDAQDAYADYDKEKKDLDYIFVETEVAKADIDTKEHFSYNKLSDILGLAGDYTDLVDGFTVKALTLAGDKISKIEGYDADKIFTAGVSAVDAYVIVDVKNGNDVVVYVLVGSADSTAKAEGQTIVSSNMVDLTEEDAYIIAGATYTVDTTVDDGVATKKTTINKLALEFVGNATTDTHANVLEKELYFGLVGQCDAEKWNTTVKATGDAKATPVYGSIAEGAYADHKSLYNEAYKCDLIKAVAVALEGAELRINAWTNFDIDFEGTMHGKTYDAHIVLAFNTDANGNITNFCIANGKTDCDMNGETVLVPYDKTVATNAIIVK